MTTVGDGAAVSLSFGVVHLVVTSTSLRSTGGSLSQMRFGSVRLLFCLRSHAVLLDYVVRIRYGVIVLSIAYSTHNSFRATATMARFPPARLAIRS